MKSRPLMVVMTPVRNEAWVLRAFLESTSKWADYIIIADQMSTDGSREIALSYEKVILIDNKNPEFNEPERQAMLIAKAREVAAGRDTLLWGLDADEILAANFQETEDWKHILNSVPGDVFWFKWAEICPDKKHYWISPTTYFPWLFHDDGKEPHGNYVRDMHSMRIPYPIEEKQMYYIDDFRVLHLAYLNEHRTAAKKRFYTFIDWERNHQNPIPLARQNSFAKKNDVIKPLPDYFTAYGDGFNLWDYIDTESEGFWFDRYVADRLDRYPIVQIRKLNIWDKEFCKMNGVTDPRRFIDKMIHHYIHLTNASKCSIVRAMDKVIKRFYHN